MSHLESADSTLGIGDLLRDGIDAAQQNRLHAFRHYIDTRGNPEFASLALTAGADISDQKEDE